MYRNVRDISWKINPEYGKDGNNCKKVKRFAKFSTQVKKYANETPVTFTRFYDTIEEALTGVKDYCKKHGLEHRHFVDGREEIKVGRVEYTLYLSTHAHFHTDRNQTFYTSTGYND